MNEIPFSTDCFQFHREKCTLSYTKTRVEKKSRRSKFLTTFFSEHVGNMLFNQKYGISIDNRCLTNDIVFLKNMHYAYNLLE